MRWLFTLLILSMSSLAVDTGAGEKAKTKAKSDLKITPGKAIVPGIGAMWRLPGELVSIDFKTRTGTFRKENNDELVHFVVLPYAELLPNAAHGDLQDFKVGELALFRMHKDEEGKLVWLTYIQGEMNHMAGHKHYYRVDAIDPAKGEITYTITEGDKSGDAKGLILETDAQTKYWKNGEPAKFSDIRVGDKLRARSHGLGKGKHHVCWDIFLDDASMKKFQSEQKILHSKRLADEGWAGYVDASSPKEVKLTLFKEGRELIENLKVGQKVRLAPAGADRKAGKTVEGTLKACQTKGRLPEATVTLNDAPPEPFVVTGVARLFFTAEGK
jgi:hypothetical protein